MNAHAAPLRIEQLTEEHDVAAFTCGEGANAAAITSYLQSQAFAEQAAGFNRVYVAVDISMPRTIVAYFTLSMVTIPVDPNIMRVAGRIPYKQVGALLLGRLGVAAQHQSAGLGSALVERAVEIARRVAQDVGGNALVVDPKDDDLVAWYERLSFVRLSPQRRRMIRPL